MKVMVADDDAQIRRLLMRALSSMGHQCRVVDGARALVAYFELDLPDLLICDVSMGDGDGIAVSKELQGRNRGLKVILMTGDPDNESRAKNAGFLFVLGKPFAMAQLEEMVEDALRP